VQALAQTATIIDDPDAAPAVSPDPDDDYLVALARSAEAAYVVSGDHHLSDLADSEPPVLAPRAFPDLLRGADAS
jgi:uncharacterized protein